MTPNTALLKRKALSVIASELRSYDVLSARQRIVYERAVVRAISDDALVPMRRCAHNVFLHEPCTKCERTLDECDVYVRVAVSRLKELIAILEGKEL